MKRSPFARHLRGTSCTPSRKRENLICQRKDPKQIFLSVSCLPNCTCLRHLVYMLLKMQEKTEELSSTFDSHYRGSQWGVTFVG